MSGCFVSQACLGRTDPVLVSGGLRFQGCLTRFVPQSDSLMSRRSACVDHGARPLFCQLCLENAVKLKPSINVLPIKGDNSLTPDSGVVDAQIGEKVMASQRNLTVSGST